MNFLVKNGEAGYSILLPDPAAPPIAQAAAELADFVRQSSGAEMAVTYSVKEHVRYISIGRTALWKKAGFSGDYSAFNNDGFVIKTIGGNIVTDAKTDRGFLYAAYELIERVLGVRFFSPEETYVPKNKDIFLPDLDVFSVPAFKLRTFLNYPTYPHGKDEAFTSHSRTLHNWFDLSAKYGGPPPLFSRDRQTHNSRFFVPAEKYGTPESTGYEGRFLTKEEGYNPHPEFYHMAEGHKPKWSDGGYGPTFDWANGITEDGKLDESKEVSVAKIVIEEMKKDILAHPEAEFFQIDQEDCVPPVTDEELIKKYKASGVVIRFCNVIAMELQKWSDQCLGGRKIKIVTFAYQQTMFAPVKKNENGEYVPLDPTVVPVDNLYIRLAYMSFHYYGYGDYRQPPEVLEMTRSWTAICKHFWFWGYDSIFNDYIVYNPTLGQVKGTIDLMRDIGVEYIIMLSSYNEPHDWQADLKQYVWTKMLWNPNLDVQQLADEYIAGYYRSAGDYVRRMMTLLDKRYAEVVAALEPGHDEYNCYHEIGLPKNINAQLLEEATAIIEEGERAVAEDARLSPSEKDILLLRLARVKFTPLWMLWKYYREFYPSASEEEERKFAEKILALRRRTGRVFKEETVKIEDFVKQRYDLSEKTEGCEDALCAIWPNE